MRRKGAQQDHAVFRNVITTQFVIGNDFPAEDPGWRIEPQRFFQHHVRVAQFGELLHRR